MRFANNHSPIPLIADWEIMTGTRVFRSSWSTRQTIALIGYLYKRRAEVVRDDV